MEMRSIAGSTESTHDERRRGSTTDLRKISEGPPIVAFTVSGALFCDLFEFLSFLFVLLDLFDIDGSLLVLVGKDKG